VVIDSWLLFEQSFPYVVRYVLGNLSGNVAARVPFSTELQSHLAVRLSSKRRVR